MKNLKNKVVFVTGASSGIGKACAEKFASMGAKVLMCARRKARIEKLAASLVKKYKTEVFAFEMDVRNFDVVKETIDSLPAKWKNIEVLLNNAGLSRGLNKIQDGVLLDWEEMIDTNVKGLLYVTKSVLPYMLKRKSAHIINIGSIAGHEVYPAGNVYCGSKHAVNAITKGMRLDLAGTSVRVSTVDPGMVNTEFSLVRYRGDKQRADATYNGMNPLNGEDIADAVAFIATRDENTVIAEMIIFPKAQASAMITHRK
ncbi:MAG TPA: SDR family NAD(P)-dependent oxidoreductase [Ignavibacteria bacterium]|nr:SDR family NAD(P)-dependent oxidoreductase [Ignavibacteria bacterium]